MVVHSQLEVKSFFIECGDVRLLDLAIASEVGVFGHAQTISFDCVKI